MVTTLVTASTILPVSLADAKTHLRVSSTTEDSYITGLIWVATEEVQKYTRRKLLRQTWKYYLDDWPCSDRFQLPYGQLKSITSVTYLGTTGNSNTLAAGNYIADTYSDPGRVVLQSSGSWPSGSLYPSNPIAVQYVCGYSTSSTGLPKSLSHALKICITDLYENRQGTIISVGHIVSRETMQCMETLLWNYRLYGINGNGW